MTTVAWLIALATTGVVAYVAGIVSAVFMSADIDTHALIVELERSHDGLRDAYNKPGSATWTDHA